MSEEGGSAGEILYDFVGLELDREEARRGSLEARGLSVATVAGAIVALIAAVQGIAGNGVLHLAQSDARDFLVVALCLFVVAVVVGAATNAPRRASLIDPTQLRTAAPDLWSKHGDVVRRGLLGTRLQYLHEVQRQNDVRGLLLFAAILLLALASIALTVSLALAIL